MAIKKEYSPWKGRLIGFMIGIMIWGGCAMVGKLVVGSKITEEKCYACGYSIGTRNIRFRDGKWYHIACSEKLEAFNLLALKIAAQIGFLPVANRH